MSLLLGATIRPLNMARRQSRDLQTSTQIIHLHEIINQSIIHSSSRELYMVIISILDCT